MRPPRWAPAFAFALLLAVSARGQELDIFETSDFFDPRIRGTEFEDDGINTKEPGVDFGIVRVIAGASTNYNWRTVPTDEPAAFLNVTASYYRGAYQFNAELTGLFSDDDASLPKRRATLQFGRYLLMQMDDPETHEPREIANRWMATATIDDSRVCADRGPAELTATGCQHDYQLELGLQIDTAIPLPRGRTALGSFILMARDVAVALDATPTSDTPRPADNRTFTGGNSDRPVFERVYRATFAGRLYERTTGPVELGFSYDVSGEYAGGLRVGAIRGGVAARFEIAGFDLIAVWRPSYAPAAGGRKFSNELAIVIDRGVFSRAIARKLHAR